jgi:hypothetical protein
MNDEMTPTKRSNFALHFALVAQSTCPACGSSYEVVETYENQPWVMECDCSIYTVEPKEGDNG